MVAVSGGRDHMVALTDAGADAEALQDSYAKRGTLLVVGLSIIIYIYIYIQLIYVKSI